MPRTFKDLFRKRSRKGDPRTSQDPSHDDAYSRTGGGKDLSSPVEVNTERLPARGGAIPVVVATAGSSPSSRQHVESATLIRPTSHELELAPADDSRPSRSDTAASKPLSLAPSYDSHTQSLGGDSRLMTNATVRKYNEDVADRNRAGSGTVTPVSGHSSIDPMDLYARRLSRVSLSEGLRRSSLVNELIPETNGERSPSPEPVHFSKPKTPVMVARDESHMQYRRRRSSLDSTNDTAPRSSDYGPRTGTPPKSPAIGSSASSFDGPDKTGAIQRMLDGSHAEGAINLQNSEDVDKTTHWAPAVTHEHVKPLQHEICEERIYREIHNHDIYHRIQPVIETEILPPRHFIPDPKDSNRLIEVSEDQLPESCKRGSQRWYMTKSTDPATQHSEFPPPQARLTAPKVVEEKSYITPEGHERKDSIILHPSTLADMSSYAGSVRPVHFGDCDENDAECRASLLDHHLDYMPDVLPVTLKEFTTGFPPVTTPSVSKGSEFEDEDEVAPQKRVGFVEEDKGVMEPPKRVASMPPELRRKPVPGKGMAREV